MAASDYTFKKIVLTGGTGFGVPIAVAGTISESATVIHTAIAGTTDYDEIWLYAVNSSSANVTLTLTWGDTGSTSHIPSVLSNSVGLYLVSPGLILNNTRIVKAYASSANKVNIVGYANRIEIE